MKLVTTEKINGFEIIETLGLCQGSTIQCKNMFSDIGSGFKQLVGGEMESYTKMLENARDVAVKRLIENAKKMGANAIVGVRYTSSTVSTGAAEILVYGTAVRINE